MRKYFLFTLFIFLLFCTPICFAEQLEVHFINVGQADAELVVLGDYAMLIDGGNIGTSQLIYTYLRELGIFHLDYIVNTHSDVDHVGGLPAAVISVNGNVYTAISPYTECYKERFKVYADKLNDYGIKFTVTKKGEIYKLGDAEFQILYDGEGTCLNDKSIVLRLTYGDTSFLFTGDAGFSEEFSILSDGFMIRSDVLKVGHHGSLTSTSEQFLNAVHPAFAVISCGYDNSYKHPSQEILDRLHSEGSQILRTDLNGHIVIVSDGHDLYPFVQHSGEQEIFEMAENEYAEISTSRVKSAMISTSVELHYVLNMRSMKFHLPDCEAVTQMSERNRLDVIESRDNLLQQGYSPCNYCRP